jgi:hypothetical protein
MVLSLWFHIVYYSVENYFKVTRELLTSKYEYKYDLNGNACLVLYQTQLGTPQWE